MATDDYAAEEMETDPDSEESGSDFDIAADALAAEMGVEATPTFRSALREAIMACVPGAYGAGESKPKPKGKKGDTGLALIFGG